MQYEVKHEAETWNVEINEVGPDLFDVRIGEDEVVRLDARTRGSGFTYSILLRERQFEASVTERDGGLLDVHVGTSAFDFEVIDERRKRLELSAGAAVASGPQTLRAEMPGKIVKVMVSEGQAVAVDDALIVIEAMKMENEVRSPVEGVVTEVGVAEGDTVETGALLATVEPPSEDGDA